jgi:hypothetical protein
VTALSFTLGAYGAYKVTYSSVPRPFDRDIILAFDRRYMRTVLNTTGFGSNYLSTKDYSDNADLKKPY